LQLETGRGIISNGVNHKRRIWRVTSNPFFALNLFGSPSVVCSTLLHFWLACHAALDAASSLSFSGFLLEFIPMKIGAGMTIIVKAFMTQSNRRYGHLCVVNTKRCSSLFPFARLFLPYSLFLQDQNKFFTTLAAVLRIDDIFCPAMPTDNYFI